MLDGNNRSFHPLARLERLLHKILLELACGLDDFLDILQLQLVASASSHGHGGGQNIADLPAVEVVIELVVDPSFESGLVGRVVVVELFEEVAEDRLSILVREVRVPDREVHPRLNGEVEGFDPIGREYQDAFVVFHHP